MVQSISQQIAKELSVKPQQIEAAIQLLDEGATVPFIARYRKEVTGGLTDTHCRQLLERLQYLRELSDRKQTILKAIGGQEKLTPELETAIQSAETKTALEDLYLPFKPKRRTKAQIAIEAGLEPLAEQLLKPDADKPETMASAFVDLDKGVADVDAALEGAGFIIQERLAEQPDLIGALRAHCWQHGFLQATVIKSKEKEASKFRDYFNFEALMRKIPSHRMLALFRGRREGVLRCQIVLKEEQVGAAYEMIRGALKYSQASKAADYLQTVTEKAWRLRLMPKIEIDCFLKLKEIADREAIEVFANNIQNLLMAAPAGRRVTIGLDPGFRTGVKVAVVDDTSHCVHVTTIFPHAPRNKPDAAMKTLAELCQRFSVELISIGNGTASRETDKFVGQLISAHPELKLIKMTVSEAGASVYSASELAAAEFPDMDVSYRGAVSIARRLQDPLAELVKIEPKAVGVGQYQHDVCQLKLSDKLHAVVEDCVNAVGVDVNTASAPLLTHVAGLSKTVAQEIVNYRQTVGAFKNRQQLLSVPRLGAKTFEQAVGFLRIMDGDDPLDSSAVHTEAYPLVKKILAHLDQDIQTVMKNHECLKSLNAADFVCPQFGEASIRDIFQELEKPGRDPRPEFKAVNFREGIESPDDLRPNMRLEGVVTNVTNFGAFVDIGVHQDGLVHKSEIADKFVSDVQTQISVGDIVNVRVIDIDKERNRINLSMRAHASGKSQAKAGQAAKADPKSAQAAKGARKPSKSKKVTSPSRKPDLGESAMAAALAKVLKAPSS
jgi:protein Tex